MKGILILVCFLTSLAFAQGGVFKSSDDLEEVANPDSMASKSFLYRVVEGEEKQRFYLVGMNNLLYGTKKTFPWPAEIPSFKKYKTPFYADRQSARNGQSISELILNDRIILTSTDSLFFLRGKEPVEVRKIDPPGITMITSSVKSTYQRLNSNGEKLERPLPAMIFTLKDSTQILLARSREKITKEVNPYTQSGQFRAIDILFEPIPELKMPTRVLPELPNRAEIDSLELKNIDQAILEMKKWIVEDSLRIRAFMDSARIWLGKPMPKENFESAAAYSSRIQAFENEVDTLRRSIGEWNRVDQILLPVRQRLRIFEAYRKQQDTYLANEELKRTQDFRGGLLNHHLWNRLYVSGLWTIGRNVPIAYSNPSPTYLSGGGLRMDWYGRIHKRMTWGVHTDFLYSQWKYTEKEENWSKQESALLGCEFGIPLGIAPAGSYQLDTTSGLVILATLGPAGGLRKTELEKEGHYSRKWTKVVGGTIGLNLIFGSLPFVVSFDYSYFHDDFGDLALRFGLPLYRWRKS